MQVRHHAERGQALIESAIAIPLFVFALLAMLTMIRAAVQSERIPLALRVNGLVAQQINPYLDYSLYEVYETAGVTSGSSIESISSTCYPPDPTILTDSAVGFPGNASAPFWSPAGTPTSSCIAYGPTGYAAGTLGLANDVLLQHHQVSLTSAAPVSGNLTKLLGASVALTGTANFFRSPSMPTILYCYPTINTLVYHALIFGSDTTESTTAPGALAATPTGTTYSASSACLSN